MRKVGIACIIPLRSGFSHEVALNSKFRSSLRRVRPADSGSNLGRDDLEHVRFGWNQIDHVKHALSSFF